MSLRLETGITCAPMLLTVVEGSLPLEVNPLIIG